MQLSVSLFLVANFSPHSTKSFCHNEPLLREFSLLGLLYNLN